MNWIEIVNLIVALWPLILQILNAISDESKRNQVADAVTTVAGRMFTGDIQVANAADVIAKLKEPLLA